MGTVLVKREVWRKPRPSNETRRSTDLTPAEQENVRRAIRFLGKRHGDMSKLAKAMGAHRETVQRPIRGGLVSAGIARKGTHLSVRFTEAEHRGIERAAKAAGVGVSEWARRAILAASSLLSGDADTQRIQPS
jgi:hypothetical protein